MKTQRGFVAAALLLAMASTHTTPASAKSVRRCEADDLRAVAYGAGLATGAEYFAIAVTNTGRRTCSIGRRTQLVATSQSGPKVAPATRTTEILAGGLLRNQALRPGQRALVSIASTPAAGRAGDADCPGGRPHPRDRIVGLQLGTGTVITLTNPFLIERCLRRIGPFTDDAWLLACETPDHIPEGTCRRL
jgi:hypothetical protein